MVQDLENCITQPQLNVGSTMSKSPKAQMHENIPMEYYLDVFSKAKAMGLPLHRSYDCAIDLLLGMIPPCCQIYPLSVSKQ